MEPLRIASEEELRKILDVWMPVEWPASGDIVPKLIQRLGWEQTSLRRAQTDLRVSNRTAMLLIDDMFSKVPGGEFVQAGCDVSDRVCSKKADAPERKRALQRAFDALLAEMRDLLGQENGKEIGRGKTVWWDLPTGGRVHLECHNASVVLYLMSRRYADAARNEAKWVAKGYPIGYEEDGTPIFGS